MSQPKDQIRLGNNITWPDGHPVTQPKKRVYRAVSGLSWIIPWPVMLSEFVPSFMNPTLIGLTRILIDQAFSGSTTIIDDPTAGDIFFPSQQLYDAANDAIIDFWENAARQDVPIGLATSTLTVGSATDVYAFDNTVIMVPTYVTLNTFIGTGNAGEDLNQRYFISDRTKLEQYARNWRNNQQAQPKWFILWDAFHLRTFPTPDKTYTFTLYGVPWTTEMGTGTEDIAVDQILRLALAYQTAATILEATRPEVADLYNQNAAEMLERYRIRLRNQQTNNIRRMKPLVTPGYKTDVGSAQKGVIKVGNRLS